MGINKGENFSRKNIYIDYPFEEVMFFWDHASHKIYRKFYGEREHSQPINHDNRLYNDALLYGDEITEEIYLKGKISVN